jgi:hypothetical protein
MPAVNTSPTAATIDALVQALSIETRPKLPDVPERLVMHMPKPHPLVRLLGVMSVAMVGALAGLLLWLAWSVHDLTAGIKIHEEEASRPPVVLLPEKVELLDVRAFAGILARRPADAAVLSAARGRALAETGAWDESLAAFAAARRQALIGISMHDVIVEADALWHRARYQEAQTALLQLGIGALDVADRGAAIELLGRCHLALRAQERAGQGECAVGTVH